MYIRNPVALARERNLEALNIFKSQKGITLSRNRNLLRKGKTSELSLN